MKVHIITSLALGVAINLLGSAETKAAEPDCASFGGPQNTQSEPHLKHLHKGDYDSSIDALTETIRADPKDYVAFLDRAGVYAAKGEDDHALADFSVVIAGWEGASFHPELLAMAHSGRGSVLMKKGEHEKAMDDFNAALRIDRVSESAYRGRAEALLRQGHFTEALVDVNRALWVRPNDAAGYTLRARIYRSLGRFSEAAVDNAHAGALLVKSRPSTLGMAQSRLYPSAESCIESDKHLVQISITRGNVTVQPLYAGTEAGISIWHDDERMMLRLGKAGCRVDIEIGANLDQERRIERKTSDADNISLSMNIESQLYSRIFHKEPSPACAVNKLTIRSHWGFVELLEDVGPAMLEASYAAPSATIRC